MRATRILAIVALCFMSFASSGARAQVPANTVAVEPAQPRIEMSISTGRSDNKTISATLASASVAERAGEQGKRMLGALMLCGGGPLPETLLQTFFELGHAKEGSLVIIPSASSLSDVGDFTYTLGQWERFPWASVQVLHARDRQQVEQDSDFVKPLQRATAVWISGGDQRRLAERYLGTSVEAELKRVVKRGGIIGGTSAGSAIASSVMISGGRQQPVIASGLDLLPGAIIDQHFSQRKRYERLASAVQQHPDRVGIGIDESTGLIVSKKQARVLGTGSVYVYPPDKKSSESFEPLRFDAGTAFALPEYPNRQD